MKNLFFKAWLLAGLLWAGVAQAKVQIVATTPDLGAIAETIGGKKVSVTTLAKPTEDPHSVDPKPSFLVQLSRADLLIQGGVELEDAWLNRLLQDSRNGKILPGGIGNLRASEGVHILEVPTVLDRSQGDVHAHGNPHFMLNPANAQIVAESLKKRLCALEPDGCNAFTENAARFSKTLEQKMKEWKAALAPFKGQRIVSYHNSWPYFSEAFDLKVDLHLEPKPGIPPVPSHLMKVIQTIRQEKIKVIIVEPFVNKRTAQKVAEETGATIVDVSYFPGGIKGTEGDYIALMDKIVASLVQALKK